MKTRNLVYGALLTALALVIPISFGGYLRIYIPPFSATLASHVPVFLAMLLGPFAAFFVGLGSTVGFLIIMGPVIAARAAVHIPVATVGAHLMKTRRFSFLMALLVVLPLHAVGEALIVIPFGFSLYDAGVVVGVGTALHHILDAAIAIGVYRLLLKSGALDSLELFSGGGQSIAR